MVNFGRKQGYDWLDLVRRHESPEVFGDWDWLAPSNAIFTEEKRKKRKKDKDAKNAVEKDNHKADKKAKKLEKEVGGVTVVVFF